MSITLRVVSSDSVPYFLEKLLSMRYFLIRLLQMPAKVLFCRALAWLKKWKRKFLLLFGQLDLNSTKSANSAHQKKPSHNVSDLTGQISKESSQYPIAQGSLGDVWKCTCINPRLEVAVKYLRIEIRDDRSKIEIIERLEHVLQQNTKLKHKNLLPFLGTAQGFGPLPAIVSPWMRNGSLTMLLERDFPQLTVVRKLQILNDIASALQYLHSRNIIHGDLNGNNVLINEAGDAFVADQGILTLCSDLNGTSYIRSNVRWAAPENFQVPEGEESSSPQLASDIYSFGCVMLQVLTGKVPYSECRSDHQVTVNILRGNKPARPETPHIEDPVWDFIQRCWLEADRRPSAKEVLGFIQGQLKLKVS